MNLVTCVEKDCGFAAQNELNTAIIHANTFVHGWVDVTTKQDYSIVSYNGPITSFVPPNVLIKKNTYIIACSDNNEFIIGEMSGSGVWNACPTVVGCTSVCYATEKSRCSRPKTRCFACCTIDPKTVKCTWLSCDKYSSINTTCSGVINCIVGTCGILRMCWWSDWIVYCQTSGGYDPETRKYVYGTWNVAEFEVIEGNACSDISKACVSIYQLLR